MSVRDLRYIEALVVQYSNHSEAYYAYSNKFPADIVIDRCFGSEDLIGKWIIVGIDHRERAREIVKRISDKFPTRIINGHVEVKVEVEHDGRTEDNVEMFHNDYYGFICDPKKVLFDVRNGVRYSIWIIRFKKDGLNCRWRVSTEQDPITPYFPQNSSYAGKLTIISGIITTHAKMGNFFLVWSVSRPRSTVCLDYNFCPINMNMLGKWAEMEVDDHNRVQKPIKIVNELYETRVKAGMTEFRIDFHHTKHYKQGQEMFDHEYFGEIIDSRQVLETIENGAWYNGWIVYSQDCGAKTCWRLATYQQVEGPFTHCPDNLTSCALSNTDRGDPNHRRRRRSRSVERMNRWNQAGADNNNSYGRESSPIIYNDYDDEPAAFSKFEEPQSTETLTDRGRRRFSSTDMQNSSNQTAHRNFHQEASDRNLQTRISTKPYVPSPSKPNRIREDSPASIHSSVLRAEVTESDSVHGSGKELQSAELESHQTEIASRYADEQKPTLLETLNNRQKSKVNAANTRSELEEDESRKETNSSNNLVVVSMDSDKVKKKEIRHLKLKLSRICELITSLTSDESVSIPMQLWSVEEYDELMSLVEANAKEHS